jgi:FKBP-type peptidyl-prolyl cis-trans isomerase FklB
MNKQYFAQVTAAMLVFGLGTAVAAPPPGLKSVQEQYSYVLGFQAAAPIVKQGVAVNAKAYAQGAQDALAGKESRLTPAQAQDAMTALRKDYEAGRKKLAEKNLAASTAFMEKNAKAADVKSLPSGLQYQVLASGTGAQAKPEDTVTVNYRGTLTNGKEFDSSYARGQPATFPVKGVIQGWQEILPMMKAGDKWKVFIPPKLAYGENGAGGEIGPNEALIFEIELLSVGSEAPEPKKQDGK